MSKVTNDLLKYQQLRIGIENMLVPVLLILFNAVLAITAVIGNSYTYIIIFAIFAVFSLLMQLLIILYSRYWRGRL